MADADELPDLPPFSGSELVRLHDLGFHDAVARLRAGATVAERGRERDAYLRIAGLLSGDASRRLASRLHDRMRDLSRLSYLRLRPITGIDTVDGALSAALLVSGWDPPHRITVYRALGGRSRSTPRPRDAQPDQQEVTG